jgi:hypothetical protein
MARSRPLAVERHFAWALTDDPGGVLAPMRALYTVPGARAHRPTPMTQGKLPVRAGLFHQPLT